MSTLDSVLFLRRRPLNQFALVTQDEEGGEIANITESSYPITAVTRNTWRKRVRELDSVHEAAERRSRRIMRSYENALYPVNRFSRMSLTGGKNCALEKVIVMSIIMASVAFDSAVEGKLSPPRLSRISPFEKMGFSWRLYDNFLPNYVLNRLDFPSPFQNVHRGNLKGTQWGLFADA